MELTFTWFIENYSYCLQKNNEALHSPDFFSELNRTAWCICLYPRGIDTQNKGYVSLFLERKFDEGPNKISLKCELAFLAAVESAVISQEFGQRLAKGDRCGCHRFLSLQELFLLQEDLLPEGKLIVSCKIRFYDSGIETVGRGSARTIIGTDHVSFLHVLAPFSSLMSMEKKTSHIQYSRQMVRVTSSLKEPWNWRLVLEITSHRKILSTCDLFLLGASGIVKKCGEGDNRFDDSRKDISILPLSLTIGDIHMLPLSLTIGDIGAGKEEYLQGDKLSILCQCNFSTGVKYETTERTLLEMPFVLSHQISTDAGNVGYRCLTEEHSTCPGAMDVSGAD